ncbi:MAG: phosphatidylglycerol lysyltransferase domain-containing protein [Tannerellaceae bacterium]|nr:phosphatidylglycerol lysyltransferase domain-containing protein [Tannerellaceae bacterium]
MDIPFKPITLQDREIITSFTLQSEYKNCDFSFANMCSWRFLYHSEFAVVEDFLVIRFHIEEDEKRPVYMCPVGNGNGDMRDVILRLEEDAAKQGHMLWLLGVTPLGRKDLEAAIPDGFKYLPNRDYFDYIYLREDLVNLTGKKYQAKRNHINKFKKSYSYEYRPITPELVPYCLELERKWYKANRTEEDEEDLSHERRSMTYALEHFSELGLIGGGICVDGQIIAFSFGAPINHDTFGIHVEKADIHYDGAYSLINQEFASHIPEQFLYVNREEDLGLPGLRQAKQSYQPALLLEKYTAIRK